MTQMYECGNHILIRADYADPAEHCHMAAHIIISLGRKMSALCDGKRLQCRGMMIPSGVTHCIDTHACGTLVFLFDSTTNAAAGITEVQVIPDSECEMICNLYFEYERMGSTQAYLSFEKYLREHLSLDMNCRVTDGRILAAMKMIQSKTGCLLSCSEVARSVFLSPGRFSHLFRQQAGMTFAAYLIFQRILKVYNRIVAGNTITEAALEAGFSSSAHFADVNRRVFGLNAGSITRNMTFVKIE